MILTLTANGAAGQQLLRLDHHGAMLGRAAEADMVLPDRAVSSRHCRIDWQSDGYLLTDTSSNGTLLNGRPLTAPQRLSSGDHIGIGPYIVAVSIEAPTVASRPASMVLDSWNRGSAAPLTATPVAAAAAAPRSATLQQPATASIPSPLPPGADAASRLLHAAGIAREMVSAGDAELLAGAGALLQQLTGGVMTLLAARDQARRELAIETPTTNNSLHRAVPPQTALAQLLGAPAAAERAVATGLEELAAHQHAALQAMQGALRATLATLSPAAIRQRAGAGSRRDPAALWHDYEAAFAGAGTDASFIELFARELGEAYASAAEPHATR